MSPPVSGVSKAPARLLLGGTGIARNHRTGLAPATGGEINSTHKTIKATIPPGAVDEVVSFTITEAEEYTMSTGSKAVRFTISPDHEFDSPVMLEVQLNDSFKQALQIQEGDEDLALFHRRRGWKPAYADPFGL